MSDESEKAASPPPAGAPPPETPPERIEDDMAVMERVAADAGKNGNLYAIDVSRKLRAGRRYSVSIALPPLDTLDGIAAAQTAVIAAAAAGRIDMQAALQLSGMLDRRRRAMATVELEDRLRALEKINAERARERRKP